MIDQHFGRFRRLRKKYYERTDPGEFDNRRVKVFEAHSTQVKDGTVEIQGQDPQPKWDHKHRKSIEEETEQRKQRFTKKSTPESRRNKNVSEIMEHIFTDQFYTLFPGFEIVIPDDSDDILNNADVIAVKWNADGEPEAIFIFDFFFAKDPNSYVYWENKLINTISRIKDGAKNKINFIESTVKKKGDQLKYLKSEGAIGLTIAIDEEELAKLVEVYEREDNKWQYSFLDIRDQILTSLAMQIIMYLKVANEKQKATLMNLAANFPKFEPITDPSKLWGVNIHQVDYFQKLNTDPEFLESELLRIKKLKQEEKKLRQEEERKEEQEKRDRAAKDSAAAANTSRPANTGGGQSNRPNFRRNDGGQRHKGKPGSNQNGNGKGKPYTKR